MRENSEHPRIGVPWRTTKEELANDRWKIDMYLRAVEQAGGEPVLLSLTLPDEELARIATDLDAYVLPGSPADVNPELYRAHRDAATAEPDADRERTDYTLLKNAMADSKPVLAICYGTQLLNVFLGGSLQQDIPSAMANALVHSPPDELPGGSHPHEVFHATQFDPGRVLDLAGTREAQVNSSHHQSILEPGRGLRITGRAADGVVESVEWEGDPNWIVGVQWHPERLPDDPLAQSLFRELVTAAQHTRTAK